MRSTFHTITMTPRSFFILSIVLCVAVLHLRGAHSDVICENKKGSISCPAGKMLDIQCASYGRTSTSTCHIHPREETMVLTDCASTKDIFSKIKEVCDSQDPSKCWITPTNHLFRDDPCVGTYKYLTVEYECIDIAVDGGWSDWSDWSICSQSCGLGFKSKSRTCTNPAPSGAGAKCSGESIERDECYKGPCPRDCQDYVLLGYTTSGVYTVVPDGYSNLQVYCDMETEGEGWLVVQRRQDGSEDFYRDWLDYQEGFGNVHGEHWLGNENMYWLTRYNSESLKIDMEDFDGNKASVLYKFFAVGSVDDMYRLRAEDFEGDAVVGDSLSYHNGLQFSTKDKGPNKKCAHSYRGGFWYGSCHVANPNGKYLNGPHKSYADGIEWKTWKGYYYSLKKVVMKIKRRM